MSENAAKDQLPGGEALVDFEWLRECTDNDTDAIKSLLDLYFNRTATLLTELDAAIANGKPEDVRRLGHACSGTSGTCGMIKLAPLFKELERIGASGTTDGAAAVATSARLEFNQAKAYADGTVLG